MTQQLDSDTQQYLETLVLEYMSRSKPFTSLDIANQAKDAGYFARNHMVADWLRHNAIALSYSYSHLYNQTLIRVNSKEAGITLAYLYHHMNDNPDNYLDRDQNPKPYVPTQYDQLAGIRAAMTRSTTPPTVPSGPVPSGPVPAGTFSSDDGGQHTTTTTTVTTKTTRRGHDGWKNQKRDKKTGRFV